MLRFAVAAAWWCLRSANAGTPTCVDGDACQKVDAESFSTLQVGPKAERADALDDKVGPGLRDGRSLGAGLREGVPYIIRNKDPRFSGWLNAELSWDSGSPGYDPPHSMASLEYDDPVSWVLRRRGGYYAILNTYPGHFYHAELSWDKLGYDHPMASVEFGDPGNWEFKHQGGNTYRIVNKVDGHWKNAELTWDFDRHRGHPMASVRFDDTCDWEVLPAYTVRGDWKHQRTIAAAAGSTLAVSITIGTEQTHSWSRERSFSATVEASAELGFEVGSVSMSTSMTNSIMTQQSQSLSVSRSMTQTTTYAAGPNSTNLWQFVIETTNHHHACRGQKALTYTADNELTGSRNTRPRCIPGYCAFDTACQSCTDPEGCIGPCL